jgi:hypothetical protein
MGIFYLYDSPGMQLKMPGDLLFHGWSGIRASVIGNWEATYPKNEEPNQFPFKILIRPIGLFVLLVILLIL